MRRLAIRASAAAITTVALVPGPTPVASADPVLVFPGMEIHQGTQRCTLGYVDPELRVAFTAGHCRGDGPVTDKDNHAIGNLATFRDNTPAGANINPDQAIVDYELVFLVEDTPANNVLPDGRSLKSVPDRGVSPGDAVCHFGVATGESCGTVDSVNNGWFTMTNGVVSKKGDSGGPIYVLDADGTAGMVGIFNSTWGNFPTGITWSSAAAQVVEDTGGVINPGGLGATDTRERG